MSGQRTQWNEATRVQMPALVHLTRIGFTYFGKITEDKAGTVYDPDTNILIEVFKSQFAKLNPERAGEAEAINIINQREAFADDDATRIMVNEAMQDITFNFSKIGEEELKMVSGGEELNEKLQRMVRKFAENIDPEDPEYITLREAFHARFHEHGFTPQNMDEFNSYSKAMDEILQKLAELQKKNAVLLRRYNGDAKFARVHKRIREENKKRKSAGKPVMLSEYDESIVTALMTIKSDIDRKVYDRNDIIFCGFIICATPIDSILQHYLMLFLKQLEGSTATQTGGSILKNVSQDTLRDLLVPIPSKDILTQFNQRVALIYEFMHNNLEETSKLQHLRDWLLPMLMNGQTTISD